MTDRVTIPRAGHVGNRRRAGLDMAGRLHEHGVESRARPPRARPEAPASTSLGPLATTIDEWKAIERRRRRWASAGPARLAALAAEGPHHG